MTSLILLSDWQESQTEFWRQIPSMPGHDVSNFGRVRSWRGSIRRRPRALILAQYLGKTNPYYYVHPQYNGKRRSSLVHRLVAMAFIPNPLNLPQVNHITGLKTERRPDALEWSTGSGNMIHALRIGLKIPKTGKSTKRMFTHNDIRAIRLLDACGENMCQIARRFKVNRVSISDVLKGKTYAHVFFV